MFITYDVFCFLCRNNVEKCEDILSKGLNIDAVCNKKKPFNSTGLILSANEGHEEVVRMLLRRNADIHYRNVHNDTALIAAAKKGHTRVVEILLDVDVNLGDTDYAGRTALIHAAVGGHLEIVNLLINREVNINDTDLKGKSALYLASAYGHEDVVDRLLEHQDIKINQGDIWGVTPIIRASWIGSLKIMNLLLSAGADVNLEDEFRMTALIHAGIWKQKQIMKLTSWTDNQLQHRDRFGNMAEDYFLNRRLRFDIMNYIHVRYKEILEDERTLPDFPHRFSRMNLNYDLDSMDTDDIG